MLTSWRFGRRTTTSTFVRSFRRYPATLTVTTGVPKIFEVEGGLAHAKTSSRCQDITGYLTTTDFCALFSRYLHSWRVCYTFYTYPISTYYRFDFVSERIPTANPSVLLYSTIPLFLLSFKSCLFSGVLFWVDSRPISLPIFKRYKPLWRFKVQETPFCEFVCKCAAWGSFVIK